jgi:hypothetical protein
MKTKKWALVFLLFTGIIFFAAQSAVGGCEVGDLDWLISGENAPGTKLEGPLTIYYHCIEADPNDCEDYIFTADMYFFLRLRKGSTLYSFAGGPEQIEVPGDLLSTTEDGVAWKIGEFFDDVVVPALYPGCNETSPDSCPSVALKSADNAVDWEPWDPAIVNTATPGLAFFITDIVVGFRD